MQSCSKQSSNALVSIIVPTYKRLDTLKRAIQTCLNQTYEQIEVIVIDDNHPDSQYRKDTQALMYEYSDCSRVRYIQRKSNGGGAVARNTGIEAAEGQYITFLDDDDEYYENKIEEQVRMMNKGYEMIFSDIEIYNIDTGASQIQTYHTNFSLDYKGLLTKHLVSIISGTPTFMYTSDALRRIGGFDDIPANQEYVLMLKTITEHLKIGYLPKALCRANISERNTRISNSEKIISAKIDVIQRIRPYLNDIACSDRRRTLFQLYLFVFYQSLKYKKITALTYGFRLLPYMDLLPWYNRRYTKISDVLYK